MIVISNKYGKHILYVDTLNIEEISVLMDYHESLGNDVDTRRMFK